MSLYTRERTRKMKSRKLGVWPERQREHLKKKFHLDQVRSLFESRQHSEQMPYWVRRYLKALSLRQNQLGNHWWTLVNFILILPCNQQTFILEQFGACTNVIEQITSNGGKKKQPTVVWACHQQLVKLLLILYVFKI